jgi:hypothetical protein
MQVKLNGIAKDKDAYWQYIRGICIICVVLIPPCVRIVVMELY